MFLTFKKAATGLMVASLLAGAGSAMAFNGQVTVNSRITAGTCTAGWGGNQAAVVNLPSVGTAEVNNAAQGEVLLSDTFTISLTNCGDDATTITAYTEGATDADFDHTFANQFVPAGADTRAEGVGVRLYGVAANGTETLLSPLGSANGHSLNYTLTTAAPEMRFRAKLIRTAAAAGTVSAGGVQSVAQINLGYD